MTENTPSPAETIALLEEKLAELETKQCQLLTENTLLQDLYDRAPIGYQSLDENGCFLSVNQTWLDTLGYRRDEIIGRNFSEFIDNQAQDEFSLNFSKFKENEEVRGIEYTMFKKDGGRILVSFDGRVGRNSRGFFQQTHCVFHDITKSRRIEEENRLFFDLIPDMVCILTRDGCLRKINGAWHSVLGYLAEELLNGFIFDLIHPQDRAATEAALNSECDALQTIQFANRFRHKDGSYRWLEWHAAQTEENGLLYAVARDVTKAKKAEQDLYEVNTILQAALDQSPTGIVIADAPDGRLRYVNCAGLAIRGTDQQAVHENLVMADYVKAWQLFELDGCSPMNTDKLPLVRALRYGETGSREFILRRAEGDDRIIFANAAPIHNESGKVVAGIVIFSDITERKQVEENLQKSENHLRTLVQTIPDLIWLKDMDGIYISCNRTFERFYGAKELEIVGKTDYDFVDSKLADFFRKNDQKAIQAGGPVSNEEWITFADDGHQALLETIKTPMYNGKGRLIGILGIGRDITKRKQAEENYQALFREMLDGCALHEIIYNEERVPVNYRFLAVNPAFERLTGLRATDIIGRTVREVLPGIEPQWIESYGKVVISGEPAYFESVSDDLEKYFEVRAYRPAPHQFACIFSDITERKRADEEKKLLQERLQQAQKMEAIGTLAGGIAHDFNNILGAILGYAEMAYEDSLTGTVKPGHLDQVVQASHRARDLIKQILAFSRQAAAQKTLVRPAGLLEESLKLLRSSMPKTIDFQLNIEPQTYLLFVDPTQFHQLVMNLCTNASHAMEKNGGLLTVSLKNRQLEQHELITFPYAKPGKFVQLTIVDNGSGIAPAIREKIFEPYFTTKETGRGTGMGLAIVHGIVKGCGGFITCESEFGRGTVFEVFLPAYSDRDLPDQKKQGRSSAGSERILFIDDEEMLAQMGKIMLERLGYGVTIQTSSEEALTAFKNDPDAYDLVITDQTMPGLTGFEMARKMLQIRPGLPIILCTGYSNIISEEKAKSIGISGFALKPLAQKDISALIRKVLDHENSRP